MSSEEAKTDERELLAKVAELKSQPSEGQSILQAKKQKFLEELESTMMRLQKAFSNKQYDEASATLRQAKIYEQALQQL